MTDAICYRDSYADRIEATVVGVPAGPRRRWAPWWSSIGPSSTRAAAASRPIGGCSCERPTAGRGWSGRRARTARTSSTSSSPATPSRRPSAIACEVELDWAAPASPDADPYGPPRPVRRGLAGLRRAGHRRQHGARQRPDGLRVRADERRPRRLDRGDGERGAGPRSRDPGQRPAPRRGLRDPRPDPDEDQPAAARDRRDPHDRDRRPRPAGRRRHARGEHDRGRLDPGHRLRIEGPDQQANPDRAGRPGRAEAAASGAGSAGAAPAILHVRLPAHAIRSGARHMLGRAPGPARRNRPAHVRPPPRPLLARHRDRPGNRQHARPRPEPGHRDQRAERRRDRGEDQEGPGDRRRGQADGRAGRRPRSSRSAPSATA